MAEGYRVLRGSDWCHGDLDGGEGHLGTVVEGCQDGLVEVVWDNGNRGMCRAGHDGKFDLRVFDTAPSGVRHPNVECVCCGEMNFFGSKWTCAVCKKCVMCNGCYVGDKHDLSHEFYRQDYPNSSSEKVKKRSICLKFQTMGIFPSAVVVRGTNWKYGDVDGGSGAKGTVQSFGKEGVGRCMALVKWSSGRSSQCRVGHLGQMDLCCLEEAPGSYCYRDHMPKLDVRKVQKPEAFQPPSPSVPEPHQQAGQETLQVGDKVCIGVALDVLKKMQVERQCWAAGMANCGGKVGVVKSFAPTGDVTVEFETLRYRLSPATLRKIPILSVGDIVRIEQDEQKVKVMQEKHGEWDDDMRQALGKVGKVVKMDADGDVVVAFGSRTFLFNPACCTPTPGASTDFISAASSSESERPSSRSTGSSSGSSNSSGSGSSFGSSFGAGSSMQAELHRDLLNLLGGLLLREVGGAASPDALYKAIGDGKAGAVKVMLDQNKQLANILHHGVTPLILSSHEGHLEIVQMLLQAGSQLEGKDHMGNTALTAAIIGKKDKVANFLLERGANARVVAKNARNCLHLAAFGSVSDVIAPLIRKGCDVNAKDSAGDTPIHDAVEKGNNAVIEILVRAAKIDFTINNSKGFNPLQLACFKGNPVATELIVKRNKAVTDLQKDDGFAAIHIAAVNDHSECINSLVVHGGARLELKSADGLTPLHLACIRTRQAAAQTLVKLKADVNATTMQKHTPLHFVLNAGNDQPSGDLFALLLGGRNKDEVQVRMACFLLENGAILNALDSEGRTPFDVCNSPVVKDAVMNFVRSKPPGVIKYRQGSAQGATGGGGGIRMGGLEQRLSVCKLCEEDFANIIVQPCNHKVMCRDCCLKVNKCPECGSVIQRRVHQRGDGGPCQVQ